MPQEYKPTISVVTCVYNDVNNLEDTMISVFTQDYINVEYVIVDGGSTDGTVELLKKYKSKVSNWISEKDNGIYDAMNKGVQMCSGDWIIFMNAGDSFFSQSVISSVFDDTNYDQASTLYGDVMLHYGEDKFLRRHNHVHPNKLYEMFCHQSIFFRKELLLKYPFDLKYRVKADFNLLYITTKLGVENVYVPVVVANYECLNGYSAINPVQNVREQLKITGKNDVFKLLKAYIKRLRIVILPTKLNQYLLTKQAKRIYVINNNNNNNKIK